MVKKSYITLKVVLGLLLVFSAISASLFIINKSLKVHAGLVNKIDDPNAFIGSWDKVLKGLDIAGNEIYSYSLNNDSSALKRFDLQQIQLSQSIDSLRIEAGNSGRKALVDTLAGLVDKRLELYVVRSYTVNENMEMKAFDKASQKVVNTEKKAVIKQNKALAEDPVKVNAKPEKNSFLKRFFSRKNKADKNPVIAPQPVVVEEKKVPEQSLSVIINSLRNAELASKEENQKKVLDLISNEQKIDKRIYSLTRLMERMEIKATQDQIKSTSANLETSTNQIMIMLGLGFFVFFLVFIYLIQRDVSRGYRLQKQLDEARLQAIDLAKARQDFAANMSHEIRTPLNALIGFSEQLAKSPLTDKQQAMANALQRSSTHLLNVINPVLDYSKLIAGKETLEQVTFKVSDVLLDTKLLYEKQASSKGIELITDMHNSVPDTISGDVVKLRQVLYNLVSNAIKFTHRGYVKLACTAQQNANGTAQFVFTVTDTGIGIPADKLETIFDEFTQADNSVTRNYGGTGLGLNIAKRLVELQEGTLKVQNNPTGGSVFTATLPYRVVTQVEATNLTQSANSSSLIQGKTIVVCDDEEINRLLLTHILTTHQAIVIEAASGKELLNLLPTISPNLILLDLHMPGLGGLEVLKTIRGNASMLIANLPVIAVTGTVVEGEKERCFAQGMNGFLNKPFLENQLIEVVEKALSNPLV